MFPCIRIFSRWKLLLQYRSLHRWWVCFCFYSVYKIVFKLYFEYSYMSKHQNCSRVFNEVNWKSMFMLIFWCRHLEFEVQLTLEPSELSTQMTRNDSLEVCEKNWTVPVGEFPKWITSLIDLSGICIRIDLITVICSPLTYCPQSELSGPEIPDDSGAYTRLQNCTFSREIDYFQRVSNRGHFIERLDDPVSYRFKEPWR